MSHRGRPLGAERNRAGASKRERQRERGTEGEPSAALLGEAGECRPPPKGRRMRFRRAWKGTGCGRCHPAGLRFSLSRLRQRCVYIPTAGIIALEARRSDIAPNLPSPRIELIARELPSFWNSSFATRRPEFLSFFSSCLSVTLLLSIKAEIKDKAVFSFTHGANKGTS